jgi:predicted nucleotidyltransferase
MDRAQLVELLDDLANVLQLRRVTARVYIVGGAAMALAYDAQRSTRDIDALILDHHRAVTEAVLEVGRRRGLPGSWLNEQAVAYLPTGADRRQVAVYDHPNLRVMAASPERLLAMKARAARTTDTDDIRLLCGLVGVSTVDEVVRVVGESFPDEPLGERSRKVLEDLLEQPDGGTGS